MRVSLSAPHFLTVKQVAEILQLSRSKVYQLIESGKLHSHKIEGSIRVAAEDLSAYLAQCRVTSAKQITPKKAPRVRLKHITLKPSRG